MEDISTVSGEYTSRIGLPIEFSWLYNLFTNLSSIISNSFVTMDTHTHMYTVDLVGTVDQFRGFILQARDTRTGNLIGSFIPLDNDKSHVLNCDPSFTNSQVLQFLVKFLILYLNFNTHFPPFLSPTFFPTSLLPALPSSHPPSHPPSLFPSLSSSPLPSPHTLSLGNCLPQKQCSRLPTKLSLAVTTATEQSSIHSLFHVCAVYS